MEIVLTHVNVLHDITLLLIVLNFFKDISVRSGRKELTVDSFCRINRSTERQSGALLGNWSRSVTSSSPLSLVISLFFVFRSILICMSTLLRPSYIIKSYIHFILLEKSFINKHTIFYIHKKTLVNKTPLVSSERHFYHT